MKLALPFVFLGAFAVSAQTPAASPAKPPAAAETKPPEIKPDAVVATLDGKPITAGELRGFLRVAGTQAQQNMLQQPAAFLTQYGMLKRLAAEAEQAKLDQKSPYKEALEGVRMQILYNALIQEKHQEIVITAEDQKKSYEANQDRYAQAKVKVIYISFNDNPQPQADPKAKKPLKEAEAKARADDLVKQLRAGGDFVKMVKEYSEDPGSAAKDGDFPAISKSDKIPENIKTVIFALKKGEISDPLRAPNGFYIFRGEEITTKSFDDVRNDIFNELKMARLNEFLQATQKSVQVKIDNEGFFKQPPPAK